MYCKAKPWFFVNPNQTDKCISLCIELIQPNEYNWEQIMKGWGYESSDGSFEIQKKRFWIQHLPLK